MIESRLEVKDAVKGFDNLLLKKQISTIKYALRKASRPIITQTRANMKARFKPSKEQLSSIKVKIARSGEYAKISIAKSYALKWIEHGTKERKTKANANRGKVKAQYFFRDAVKATEQQCKDILIKSLSEKLKL